LPNLLSHGTLLHLSFVLGRLGRYFFVLPTLLTNGT